MTIRSSRRARRVTAAALAAALALTLAGCGGTSSSAGDSGTPMAVLATRRAATA